MTWHASEINMNDKEANGKHLYPKYGIPNERNSSDNNIKSSFERVCVQHFIYLECVLWHEKKITLKQR